jgi:hypothetical protein
MRRNDMKARKEITDMAENIKHENRLAHNSDPNKS